MHDILRDNAPFTVVGRDSAAMRRWLETGRSGALNDLPKVTDGRSYWYVLGRYVGGFRDGHISFGLTKGAIKGRMPDWPSFVLSRRNGAYVVGWADPSAEDVPPIGATLVGCGGQSTETLVKARLDRVFGNMNMEAERSAFAFQLLRDYHYPVESPKTCTFRSGGQDKTWKLRWSTPAAASVDAAWKATASPRAKFGVSRWGENAWWIGVPSMSGDEEWKALYAEIEKNLGSIRTADALVIDLRGNGGGNSDYGVRLAHLLYGDEVADEHGVTWGDLVFKDGPLSRQWASEQVSRAKDDPDRLALMEKTVEELEAAPLGSKVVIGTTIKQHRQARHPQNPMKGHVTVLIDRACFSACLDTLDVFTRLPGVKLAGVETGGDTIFMDAMRAPLPSGKATMSFGIKAWAQRVRGSNVTYKPDAALRYSGSMADELGLRRWLGSKLKVRMSS